MSPGNPATAEAIAALARSVDGLGEEVRDLPDRLEKLEKRERERDEEERERERRTTRRIRILGFTVAVLALLLALLAIGFAVWTHRQDVSRAEARQRRDAQVAALQREDVRFREGMCAASPYWRQYLKEAPQGGPAGQAAARYLEGVFRSLCGR